MNQIHRRGVLLLAATCLAAPAFAQSSLPAGPISIVVPFGTGNGLDSFARAYAARLGAQMNTNVIVENREGAGGLIGTMAVARATPNGQTLVFTAEYPFLTSPYMQSGTSYQPTESFVPVAKVALSPHVVVVGGNSPLKTLDDLVAFAKANPGRLNFASSGISTPSHLYMERLLKDVGATGTHVPYKSTGNATTDVVGGQADAYMPSLSAVLPLVRDGKLRVLAIGSKTRTAKLPGVPTLAEALKRPGLSAYVWFGFLAPKGTPVPIVERLQREIEVATKAPAITDTFAQLDADIAFVGSLQFASEIRDGDKAARELLVATGALATK
jgi:tripartite-type tricarboxylate transporter receptor subunit TctC